MPYLSPSDVHANSYPHRGTRGGGGGGGVDPPQGFLFVAGFRNDCTFSSLYKMRYILWVVALLGNCDVTNNGRHLGFYRELECRLKPREMVIFCA